MVKTKPANDRSPDRIDADEADYLYVRESAIKGSGMGLFTAIAIYKDEIIAVFEGDILTAAQALKRAKKGEDAYFINLPDGRTLDSMFSGCFAKFANDAKGYTPSTYEINTGIALDDFGNVCLVAKRNIAKGEEIFCSYGPKYWRNFKRKLMEHIH